jgi:hypothetical protein
MEKFVQVTTDDNGNTTYSMAKENYRDFVKTAGNNPDAKKAARIIGRFMKLNTYNLKINTKSDKNKWEPTGERTGIANVNSEYNPKYNTSNGEKESTLNQRIAHEAFGEAFYGLVRRDLRKNPSEIYNEAYDEFYNSWPYIDDAVEKAINYGTVVAEPGNVEIIQYENIFNRLLNNPERLGTNHGVRSETAESGATTNTINIEE